MIKIARVVNKPEVIIATVEDTELYKLEIQYINAQSKAPVLNYSAGEATLATARYNPKESESVEVLDGHGQDETTKVNIDTLADVKRGTSTPREDKSSRVKEACIKDEVELTNITKPTSKPVPTIANEKSKTDKQVLSLIDYVIKHPGVAQEELVGKYSLADIQHEVAQGRLVRMRNKYFA